MDFAKHPLYDWLSQLRRELHAHPELAFAEVWTTQKIKEVLGGLGLAPEERPGLATGLTCLIAGRPGPQTLALRADIDALPITEQGDAPYKSQNEGVMHACGHDCHTAIMLGVAKKVVESGLREKIRGNLRFIFQPAEERILGAQAMIAAGALEDPPVTRILAGHMDVDHPVGKVSISQGVCHASSDSFQLTITGQGGHGARPHLAVDPIPAGIHFYNAAQTIISRNIDAQEAGVLSICQFRAGTAANVVPEEAFLGGTVRALSPQVRELIIRRLKEIAGSLKTAFGVTANLAFNQGVPPNVNEEAATHELVAAAAKVLGRENVFFMPARMGSEDFALYAQRVPAAFLRLGCANLARGITHPAHSSRFAVDEAVLPVGVEIFTQAVEDYLS